MRQRFHASRLHAHNTLNLLDFLNATDDGLERLLSRRRLSPHDVDDLQLLRRACRRRLDRLSWRRREPWRVDGPPWTVKVRHHRLLEFQEDRHQSVGARQAAEAVVSIVRRHRRTKRFWPAWPEAFRAREKHLSRRARNLVRCWRSQWESLRNRPLRRCACLECPVVGGRYFVADRNARDCSYCRRRHRQHGPSKATRWRRRLLAAAL